MWTILLFLLILSVLVFVHELGHFLVARWMGMEVEEFGFGFPPRAWSIKRGETEYSINWIPMGGFVRIKGEDGNNQAAPNSFASKKIWQRALVLIAGVVMNFLLAALILGASFAVGAPTTLDGGVPAGATVRNVAIRIAEVVDASPAARAGLVPGEQIVGVDGQTFNTDTAFRAYVVAHGDAGVAVAVENNQGVTQTVHLVSENLTAAPGVHGVGLGLVTTGVISFSPPQAFIEGFVAAAGMVRDVCVAFVGIIESLATGHGVGADIAGPVGIAVMTGNVVQLGWIYLLPFIATLSANLAVVNLIPFPALDGGRLFLLLIEAIRRKPVKAEAQAWLNGIGFLALMLLILVVTIHDVTPYALSFFSTVHSWIIH